MVLLIKVRLETPETDAADAAAADADIFLFVVVPAVAVSEPVGWKSISIDGPILGAILGEEIVDSCSLTVCVVVLRVVVTAVVVVVAVVAVAVVVVVVVVVVVAVGFCYTLTFNWIGIFVLSMEGAFFPFRFRIVIAGRSNNNAVLIVILSVENNYKIRGCIYRIRER